MVKARGNTKTILQKVGELQDLIGRIDTAYHNDGGRSRVDRAGKVGPLLKEAHELCVEIRSMYDPL